MAIETGDLSMEDEDWQGDSMASIRAALIAERAAAQAAAAAAAGTLPPSQVPCLHTRPLGWFKRLKPQFELAAGACSGSDRSDTRS